MVRRRVHEPHTVVPWAARSIVDMTGWRPTLAPHSGLLSETPRMPSARAARTAVAVGATCCTSESRRRMKRNADLIRPGRVRAKVAALVLPERAKARRRARKGAARAPKRARKPAMVFKPRTQPPHMGLPSRPTAPPPTPPGADFRPPKAPDGAHMSASSLADASSSHLEPCGSPGPLTTIAIPVSQRHQQPRRLVPPPRPGIVLQVQQGAVNGTARTTARGHVSVAWRGAPEVCAHPRNPITDSRRSHDHGRFGHGKPPPGAGGPVMLEHPNRIG